MPNNELLNAALFYTRLGWNVIPLQPKSKKPLLKSWQVWQKERVTEDTVALWWDKHPNANIGIVTGEVSGIVVLDVDGDAGRESLSRVAKGMPPTPVSQTGKGMHYIFKHPGYEVHNFAGKLPGLDFRGDGGYIVAPPSIHPSGQVYQWSIDPRDAAPEDLPQWLVSLVRQRKEGNGGGIDPLKILDGVPEGERDNALFRYACRLRAQGIKREEATVLILQAANNCHPPFPEADARAKIESAWRYPDGEAAKKKVDLENIKKKPESVWDAETIGALAVLKKDEPAAYARLKAELKGTVNLNDLERAVNKQMAENQRLRIVEPGEEPEPLDNILPNIPLKELRRPYQWTINENGIWQDSEKHGPICACSVPVILTKRLKSIDDGSEKVELAFYRDRDWHFITMERSMVFSRTGIILLADKSLPVSSENSRDLVRFLTELEAANLKSLPIHKSTSSLGWAGKNFIPGAQGKLVLDLEDGTASIANGYRECGSLERWIELAEAVRQYPIARFMLAASFAAPLLKMVKQRVFIIHAWGSTRGGKTAALKAALSVWGDPDALIASFNATKVGLERLASFYSDLPLGIDEKQVVGNRQGFVEGLVYLLGLGKGKVRGAKHGGLQTINHWRSLVLSTGEEPITTESSMGGVATRVLEMYGRPIPDEEMAIGVHRDTTNYHGTAGPEFIRKILSSDIEYPEMYESIQEVLKAEFPSGITSHTMGVALVALADYLASLWIFGLDEKQAAEESLDLAREVMGMQDAVAQADDGARAYNYLMSWYSVNAASFKEAGSYERYGIVDKEALYIFPTIFDKAMREGGFNPRRVLQDWADRGWIKWEMRGGKKRLRYRKYDPWTGRQTYFTTVLLDVDTSPEAT